MSLNCFDTFGVICSALSFVLGGEGLGFLEFWGFWMLIIEIFGFSGSLADI